MRIPDVTEMDMGEWEGLTFSEIRGRFPKSYAQRGMDWSTPMPGGETLAEAADRMQAAAERLAKAEEELSLIHIWGLWYTVRARC